MIIEISKLKLPVGVAGSRSRVEQLAITIGRCFCVLGATSMRMLFNVIGSAMNWAEQQSPLELVVSGLAMAAILYVVLVVAEGPRG